MNTLYADDEKSAQFRTKIIIWTDLVVHTIALAFDFVILPFTDPLKPSMFIPIILWTAQCIAMFIALSVRFSVKKIDFRASYAFYEGDDPIIARSDLAAFRMAMVYIVLACGGPAVVGVFMVAGIDFYSTLGFLHAFIPYYKKRFTHCDSLARICSAALAHG